MPSGLTRYIVLFVIDYATRKVGIAGIILQADGQWMKQIARQHSDPLNHPCIFRWCGGNEKTGAFGKLIKRGDLELFVGAVRPLSGPCCGGTDGGVWPFPFGGVFVLFLGNIGNHHAQEESACGGR